MAKTYLYSGSASSSVTIDGIRIMSPLFIAIATLLDFDLNDIDLHG
jgi:hypothetical protein